MNVLRYFLKLATQALIFALFGGAFVVRFLSFQRLTSGLLPGRMGHVFGFGLVIWLIYRLIWSLVKRPDPLSYFQPEITQ
jgi:hypothetical protein